MKHFTVVERKHGVSLHIEDTGAMTREVHNFTWQEWSGLFWAIEHTKNNPSFKFREPRERNHNGGISKSFVKRIELVGPDDES